ncbi:MAG: Na+/H+ antiporter subunit C [Bryobacteraceae bacterium]
MTALLSIVIGALYAGGVYMMLRRSIVKHIIGLALLAHATHLLIFTAGGLMRGRPPLVPTDRTIPFESVADPLPQALILTAIVISFGLLAFALALLHRTTADLGTDDLDQIRTTEQ